MANENNEEKRQKIEKYAKWGLGIVGAVIISPIIFLAVKGIVGLGLALLIGTVITQAAPYVGMKFANWKLRAIKHEARTNPVETLQNVFGQKMAALNSFSRSITDFATEVNNFSDKVDEFKKLYPQDAQKFADQLEKMKQLLTLRRKNYKEVQKELAAFESEIQRASAIWDMAQAAVKMNAAAGMNDDDILEKIKTETAVDAVQGSLNRAFAELETSLMDEPVEATTASSTNTTESRFHGIEPKSKQYQKASA